MAHRLAGTPQDVEFCGGLWSEQVRLPTLVVHFHVFLARGRAVCDDNGTPLALYIFERNDDLFPRCFRS